MPRSKIACMLICLVLMTLTAAGCTKTSEPAKAFISEQDWIVSSIGEDIGGIVLYAAHQANSGIDFDSIHMAESHPKGEEYGYALTWNTGKADIQFKLEHYVWNPSTYVPWVKQLEKHLNVKSKAAGGDDSDKLIFALASFSAKSIAENNRLVSDELSRNPLDADPNEKAALLCALYALRENAACFADVRPWLNRIAAHLAIAQAARDGKPLGSAGELSNAVLLGLAGRQSDSLIQLKAIEAQSPNPSLQSWIRALKIRITHDYRMADMKNAKLVEKLERGRALAGNIGSDAVTDYLQKSGKLDESAEELPVDWVRIGIRGISSVESGHIYAEEAVKYELSDLAKDLKAFRKTESSNNDALLGELGGRPTRCLVKDNTWQLQPISWNDLSNYHCRHILDSAYQTYGFLKNMWGVPDQAKEFFENIDSSFSKIPTYPLCKLAMLYAKGDRTVDQNLMNTIGELAKNSPEAVPFDLWKFGSKKTTPEVLDVPGTWFVPALLFGTTFQYDEREVGRQFKVPQLKELRDLAPYDRKIACDYVCGKFDTEHQLPLGTPLGHLLHTEIQTNMRDLLEYDTTAMRWACDMIWDDDKELYGKMEEKIATIDPNNYFSVGDFYQTRDPQKALAAYENGLQLGRNDVLASNSCAWLVNYYYDHGNKDEALQIAQKVAEVYSSRGLLTMARLYERMGKLAESEKYFKDEQERYGGDEELCGFYLRNSDKNPAYEARGKELQEKLCPNELQKFDKSQVAAPPTTGVLLTSTTFRMVDGGMEKGDIVVSVNGYATPTIAEYKVAKELSKDIQTQFVFWSKKKKEFKTVKLPLCERRLGCEIRNYVGAAK